MPSVALLIRAIFGNRATAPAAYCLPSAETGRSGLARRFRLLGSQEGANLVETALTMAVLIPIMIGTIDFSFAFYAYQDIADAARQASRWAAVRGSTSCTNVPSLNDCNATSGEIKSFVQGLNYAGVASANEHVTTTWLVASSSTPTSWSTCSTSPCNVPGNEVQVNVTYSFPIAIPFWKAATFDINSTGSMVIAQ